MWELE